MHSLYYCIYQQHTTRTNIYILTIEAPLVPAAQIRVELAACFERKIRLNRSPINAGNCAENCVTPVQHSAAPHNTHQLVGPRGPGRPSSPVRRAVARPAGCCVGRHHVCPWSSSTLLSHPHDERGSDAASDGFRWTGRVDVGVFVCAQICPAWVCVWVLWEPRIRTNIHKHHTWKWLSANSNQFELCCFLRLIAIARANGNYLLESTLDFVECVSACRRWNAYTVA